MPDLEIPGIPDAADLDGTEVLHVVQGANSRKINVDVLLAHALCTGLMDGGDITINADPTLLDISAGEGYVVDTVTTPSSPTLTRVTWTAFIGVSPSNILTDDATFLAISSAGAIVESDVAYTPEQRRTLIPLGRAQHNDHVNINVIVPLAQPAHMVAQAVWDIMEFLGIGNFGTGNVYGPNGANLSLNKTAGRLLSGGSNFGVNKNNPNVPIQVAQNPAVFGQLLSSFRNGSGGWITAPLSGAFVDPAQYDDGSGTLQSVPANRWTIQPILLNPQGITIMPYGQVLYNSQSNAEEAISDAVELNPDFSGIAMRAWLIVRGNTTALDDTGNNTFFEANKFGGLNGGAAGGGAGVTSHSALTDLTADDHGHYARADGTRPSVHTDTRAPLPTDDDVTYAVGSSWINTVTGNTYVCIDASTGAAVWSVVSGFTQAASALSGTRYYQSGLGSMPGNVSGYTMSIAFRMIAIPTTFEDILGMYAQFQPEGGHLMGVDALRFKFGIAQASDSAMLENFVGGEYSSMDLIGRLIVMTYVYDGTSLLGYVQASEEVGITPTGGYDVGDAGNRLMLGRNNNTATGAPSVEFLGGGYDETVFTPAEVAAHYIACKESDSFQFAAFDNVWTFEDLVTEPSTLLDVVGSEDLSIVGTPVDTVAIKRVH